MRSKEGYYFTYLNFASEYLLLIPSPNKLTHPNLLLRIFFIVRFSRTFDVLLVNQSNTSDILPKTSTKHLPCEARERAEG